MTDSGMVKNAFDALASVLSLTPGESAVVLYDESSKTIAEAFQTAAERHHASVQMLPIEDSLRPLQAVPEHWIRRFEGVDVAVNLFAGRPDETPFRVSLVQMLRKQNCRTAHAPGITTKMLEGGPLAVEFFDMKEQAKEMVSSLRDASYLRVENANGTDLTLYVEGRPFATDVVIGPGQMGNLPCGEVWSAPVEFLGEGTLVVDGTVGDLGAVPVPVILELAGGRITSVRCDDSHFLKQIESLLNVDEDARRVGEFGLGINPKAQITGNILEDGKAQGTARIAFGNNLQMPGGSNSSKTHRDLVFRNPDIVVHYTDGRAARMTGSGLAQL